MKSTVKKFISFRINRYKEIELKLEQMAEKGLFLEKMGTYLWTFRRAEPKKTKYTVTYFSEASLFNPSLTENQRNYHNLAKESGWNFITEFNQMQIFCNEDENPTPFETDEREKFENIKKCMRKSFIPSHIILIVLFLFNIFMEYKSFRESSLYYLSRTSNLYIVAIMLPALIYLCYILLDYFIWCQQCERSISKGGGCIEKIHKYQKLVDVIIVSYVSILVILILKDLFVKVNFLAVILTVIYVPILIFVYRFSIYFLKKKNVSAMTNRVVSIILLMITSFVYMFSIINIIMKVNLPRYEEHPYRLVSFQYSPTDIEEFKVYSDDIPLRCEDLYKNINYENYSYEEYKYNSIFLIRNQYRQDALPELNPPPEIEYDIIEPKYPFVRDIVIEDMKKLRWGSQKDIKEIDNLIFNTEQAYIKYYDNTIGEFDYDIEYNFDKENYDDCEYLLIYKDKIVRLYLEEPVKDEQVEIIMEKLKLN